MYLKPVLDKVAEKLCFLKIIAKFSSSLHEKFFNNIELEEISDILYALKKLYEAI